MTPEEVNERVAFWLSGWDKPRKEIEQDFMQLKLNLAFLKEMQKEGSG